MKFGSCKDVRLNVRLADYQYDFLKDCAIRNNCTLSEMMRKILEYTMLSAKENLDENIKRNIYN